MVDRVSIKRMTQVDVQKLINVSNICNPIESMNVMDSWMVCNVFQKYSYFMEKNDEIVGYIVTATNDTQAIILNLGVVPKHRNQGNAQILIDTIVQDSSLSNKEMRVVINQNNTAAVNAFKKYCMEHNKDFSIRHNITDLIDKSIFTIK